VYVCVGGGVKQAIQACGVQLRVSGWPVREGGVLGRGFWWCVCRGGGGGVKQAILSCGVQLRVRGFVLSRGL